MPCSVAVASVVPFNYVLLAVAVDVLLSGTYTCLSRLVAVTFAVLLLRRALQSDAKTNKQQQNKLTNKTNKNEEEKQQTKQTNKQNQLRQ
jgi:flagellar biosynthesis component FlhA